MVLNDSQIKDYITFVAESKKFVHAYVIEDEQKSGGFFAAMLLCHAIMCENNMCFKCKDCQKLIKNIHPDLVIIEPNKKNIIPISVAREIKALSAVLPNEATKRVFIIKEADKLNLNASNALLKLLEEPSDSNVFILLCENKKLLLKTIVSRCMCFNAASVLKSASEYPLLNCDILKTNKEPKNIEFCERFISLLNSNNKYDFIKILYEIDTKSDDIYDLCDDLKVYLASRLSKDPQKGVKLIKVIDRVAAMRGYNANKNLAAIYLFNYCWEEIH